MAGRRVLTLTALLASILATSANAQKVLLLPGARSTVNTFTVEPFAAATPWKGGTGAFTILTHPSGDRYFFVSRWNVRVVDNAGISLHDPVSFRWDILAAAITPDGRKLLVAAGNSASGSLYIFDVSGGTMKQTGAVATGGNPVGVTGSMDSVRGFVLTAEGLTSVDLGTNTAGTMVGLGRISVSSSNSSKVVLGLNGLLYVNADRTLYEINADSMTIRRAIALNGFPSPPAFTPDGATALITNRRAGERGETGLLMLDLKTYAIKSIPTLPGVHLTKAVPTNSRAKTIYAVASQFGGLYQVHPDFSGIAPATFPGGDNIGNVVSAFTSAELPNSLGIPGPRYLFVISQSALHRIDLDPTPGAAADQITKSLPLSITSPEGIYFVPPSTNGPVVSVLKYGDGQVLEKDGVSAPLVVRAVDSGGRPVSGVEVKFTPSAGSIVSAMSATNSEGFAEAIVTAPQLKGTTGAFAVNVAIAGKAATSFSLRAGTLRGGTHPVGSGLSIFAGDGQVIRGGGKPETEPLTVRVAGTKGEPVVGAPVEFSVVEGSLGGSIRGVNCAGSNPRVISCLTSGDGTASVQFTAPQPEGTPFLQTTVTASVAGVGGVPDRTVSFFETWTPAATPERKLEISEPANRDIPITVRAGTTRPRAIQASIFAQSPVVPIPNVSLAIYGSTNHDPAEAAPAYCSGWIPLSNSGGVVTCDLVVPPATVPGKYVIYAVFGGNTVVPLNLEVTSLSK